MESDLLNLEITTIYFARILLLGMFISISSIW